MKATNQLTGFIIKFVFIALFFVIAFAGELFSQDLIIKRDNSEMKVKVIEFEGNLIKYKPFDFLEGPLRSIPISDVLKIVYENGRVENFVIVETPQREVPIQQVEVPQSVTEPVKAENYNYFPMGIFLRVSGQIWHNEGLSEFFGTNVLYGGGIEKQVSTHFKFGGDFDFASKTKDEVTFRYTQFGGFVKFTWGDFGGRNVVIYSELGAKGVSLKGIEGQYSSKGTGFGFSALLGLEISLGAKTTLNLGWNSVFGNITFEDETVNVGNEIFSGGLIFNLW
jgi:hypothetical protein